MKKDYSREHELAAIADAWSTLPSNIKRAILLLVGAKGKSQAIATVEKNKVAAMKSKPLAQIIAEMRGDSIYASATQVAKILGITRSTVYRLIKAGKLSAVEINDAMRIPWRSVEDFIDRNTIGG